MEQNKITLEESKTFIDEENFYFDDLSGKPYWDLRKMLGRQLFKIRQDYNRTLTLVSKETLIPVAVIDQIEVGCKDLRWKEISRLLDYYQKHIKLKLVDRYSEEERAEISKKRKNDKLITQAQEILRKAQACKDLKADLVAAGAELSLTL